MLLPVILSGGSGTRLWPLSRASKPKQFLNLIHEISLFQKTVERARAFSNTLSPLIICNEAHRFLVAEQLRDIGVKASAIILEPMGKNTAPAATLAALFAVSRVSDTTLLIMPSDHLIINEKAFKNALAIAVNAAKNGFLVTFGIKPAYPEVGYGYIKRGKPLSSEQEIFQVEKFVEKPDVKTAQIYVDSKEYYWNSGMFVFQASKWLEEIGRFAPQILAACKDTWEHIKIDEDFYRLPQECFVRCKSDSIDYAVMEKTKYVAVVPADIDWSDVGSWNALKEIGVADENGNVTGGAANNVFIHESQNCYARAENRTLALVGVRDLVVIETSDAVLIANRDELHEIKTLVEIFKENKKEDLL